MSSPRNARIGPHWVVMLSRADQPAAEVERHFACGRMLVPDERLVAVLASDGPPRVTPGPPLVVEAPGGAACLLLASAYVLACHPNATLLFLPTGADVDPESHLLRQLVASSLYARRFPDDLILLGHPAAVDAGAGGEDELWLEVAGGRPSLLPQPLLRVHPWSGGNANGHGAKTAWARRLRTTGCFSVWGPTLWTLARRYFPELADRCDELRLVLRGIGDGRMARAEEERVLSRLGTVCRTRSGFLASVLCQAPEAARVLAVQPPDPPSRGDRV
jgi:hypothetical protein